MELAASFRSKSNRANVNEPSDLIDFVDGRHRGNMVNRAVSPRAPLYDAPPPTSNSNPQTEGQKHET